LKKFQWQKYLKLSKSAFCLAENIWTILIGKDMKVGLRKINPVLASKAAQFFFSYNEMSRNTLCF
jgi:hypothetical protein